MSEHDAEKTLEQLRSKIAGFLLNIHAPKLEATIMTLTEQSKQLLDNYTELKFAALANALVAQVNDEVKRILREAEALKGDQLAADALSDDELLDAFVRRAVSGAYDAETIKRLEGLLKNWISV